MQSAIIRQRQNWSAQASKPHTKISGVRSNGGATHAPACCGSFISNIEIGLKLGQTLSDHTSVPHQTFFASPTMTTDRRAPVDRRSGKDRRQEEKGPPSSFERRRTVEARQPEMVELQVTEEELKALGFGVVAPTSSKKPD